MNISNVQKYLIYLIATNSLIFSTDNKKNICYTSLNEAMKQCLNPKEKEKTIYLGLNLNEIKYIKYCCSKNNNILKDNKK